MKSYTLGHCTFLNVNDIIPMVKQYLLAGIEVNVKVKDIGSVVGKPVRVKGGSQIAIVEREYNDVEGGVRLDRVLDGFKSWNIIDLEFV